MKVLAFALTLLVALPIAQAEDLAAEKIGILLCLSGDCAQWGRASLNGANLAIDEINARGGLNGRKLIARVEDSREAKPSDTITAFQSLASDPSIRLIIGPSWTPAGMALAPLAAQKRLILITPSMTVSDFSKTARNIFNAMPPEDLMTKALAEFAIRRGWRKVAIFASQHPAEFAQGKIFESSLKELGGTVSFFANPLPDAPDLRTEALRIHKSAPDAVYVSNWWGTAPKALRAAGYVGPVLTRQMDPQRLEAAGGSLNNSFFPRYPKPSSQFETKYRERFKEDPPLFAATSYDIVQIYANVARQISADDFTGFERTFAGTNFEGTSGLILFGPDRTVVTRSVEIAQVAGEDLNGPDLG